MRKSMISSTSQDWSSWVPWGLDWLSTSVGSVSIYLVSSHRNACWPGQGIEERKWQVLTFRIFNWRLVGDERVVVGQVNFYILDFYDNEKRVEFTVQLKISEKFNCQNNYLGSWTFTNCTYFYPLIWMNITVVSESSLPSLTKLINTRCCFW